MATTGFNGGVTESSSSDVPMDIIQAHILNKLDGYTLISAGCASSEIHAFTGADDQLWARVCRSTWPSLDDPRLRSVISSFPSGHRSLFSDSFPTPDFFERTATATTTTSDHHQAAVLISAVDLRYRGELLFSRVEFTVTTTGRFLLSPFEVDFSATSATQEPATCGNFNDVELSWIVIDPSRNLSANISSVKPLTVSRSDDGTTPYHKAQYGTAYSMSEGDVAHCSIEVTCGGKERGEMHVSLQVKDIDGRNLSGKESLVILGRVMERGRPRRKRGMEKMGYEMYLEKRRKKLERKKWEGMMVDLLWLAIEISVLVLLWIHFYRMSSQALKLD